MPCVEAFAAAPTAPSEEPRKIFAHYMGCFPVGYGSLYLERYGVASEREGFRHDSKINREALSGGRFKAWPLSPAEKKMDPVASADLEIRRAIRDGIDGFDVDAWAGGVHLNEWAVGERYGRSMIEDLNHWSVGWVDWNMVLDQQGGPNHVGNFTSSPIIAHTDTGEVSYQSSYYYLGQFSKFIHPGAVRVLAAPTSDSLETTAFVNPDGSTVVVVMNRTEIPVRFELELGTQAARMDAPQRSIQTIVVNP